MSDADDFRLFRDQRFQLIHTELPIVGDRDMLDDDSAFLGLQLPGNDIRMVLHLRDKYLIARLHLTFAERTGHEVDGLRRSTGEDYLLNLLGVDKLLHLLTGRLVQIRSLLRQIVYPTMHIGIHIEILVTHSVKHTKRFLCGSGVIQVDQWLTIYLP